jgi:EAL domain
VPDLEKQLVGWVERRGWARICPASKRYPSIAFCEDDGFREELNPSYALPEDCQDQAIAQAIISMGKALGMTIVAEGVETAEQQSFLRDPGCDEMQGFLFSKAVLPEQIADLLRPSLHVSPPLAPAAAEPLARRSRKKSA